MDNPTEITATDVFEAVRTLKYANAKTIAMGVEGTEKFGTGPVRDAYWGLCSSQLIGNLDQVQGFISKNNYPNTKSTLPSEWGSINNVRYLVSSMGSVSTGASALGADVFNMFIVGQESYAIVDQDGYSAHFVYRPPIYDGPLMLNFTLGWKMSHVARILNDAWILNQRCTLI